MNYNDNDAGLGGQGGAGQMFPVYDDNSNNLNIDGGYSPQYDGVNQYSIA